MVLTVVFQPVDDRHVRLQVIGGDDPTITISVVHANSFESTMYNQDGNDCSAEIFAETGDALTLLVRTHDFHILACSTFEVAVNMLSEHGIVLSPISLHNMLIEQVSNVLAYRTMKRSDDTVVTQKRVKPSENYIAWFRNDPDRIEKGRSEAEAIGNLYLSMKSCVR